MSLKNLTITGRFLIVMSVVGLFLIKSTTMNWTSLGSVTTNYSQLIDNVAIGQNKAAEGTRAILRGQREIYRALLNAQNPDAAEARLNASRQALTLAEETIIEAGRRLSISEETQGVLAIRRELSALADEISAALRAERRITRVADFQNRLDQITVRSREATDKITTNTRRLADAQNARLSAEAAVDKQNLVIMNIVAMIATMLVLYVLIQIQMGRPMSKLEKAGESIAAGDLDTVVPFTDQTNEIGRIAKVMETMRQSAVRLKQLETEAAESQRNAAILQKQQREKFASSLEDSVGSASAKLSSTGESLRKAITQIDNAVSDMQDRTENVKGTVENATQNVQSVASASEELSASVNEIGRQVSQAANIAKDAVTKVDGAQNAVLGLASASEKISDVVKLISDIAGQTNLLALNATIEAARAGEAGKGFAVVASEVKALATQTAKATENISSQIGAIQQSTSSAVNCIQEISHVVEQIDKISSAIAAAVDQQESATREIAKNAAEAADRTQKMSDSMSHMETSVTGTVDALEVLRVATSDVTHQSREISKEIGDLSTNLRKDV